MNEEFDKKLDSMSKKYGLKKQPEKESGNLFEGYFLGIGLITHIFIGLFLGYWVDKFFNTSPFGILIFLLIGFAAGFRHIWINIK